MATGNNRKENTFKTNASFVVDPLEEQIITTEEKRKEEKPKKEKSKKSEKTSKGKDSKPQKTNKKDESDGRVKRIIGILFICLAVFLGLALISYLVSFFSGHHQEYGYQIFSQKVNIENRTGRAGVFLAQTLIKESFGIGAFFFVYLLTLIGLWLTDTAKIKMWSIWKYALLSLVWLPLFFALIAVSAPKCAIFGGAVGLWLNNLLTNYVGKVGVIIILAFLFLVFAVYQFNLTLNYFKELREKRENERRHQAAILAEQRIREELERERSNMTDDGEDIDPDFIDDEDDEPHLPPVTSFSKDPSFEIVTSKGNVHKENVIIHPKDESDDKEITLDPNITATYNAEPQNVGLQKSDNEAEKVELVIENTPTEETVEKGKDIERHTIDTPFDPRYELRDYKFPTFDMLNEYGGKKAEIDNAELEANKNKIVETLGHYGIAIDKIKATIGPTVT